MVTESSLLTRFDVSNPVCFEFKRGRVARSKVGWTRRTAPTTPCCCCSNLSWDTAPPYHPMLVGSFSTHDKIPVSFGLILIICQNVCLMTWRNAINCHWCNPQHFPSNLIQFNKWVHPLFRVGGCEQLKGSPIANSKTNCPEHGQEVEVGIS